MTNVKGLEPALLRITYEDNKPLMNLMFNHCANSNRWFVVHIHDILFVNTSVAYNMQLHATTPYTLSKRLTTWLAL